MWLATKFGFFSVVQNTRLPRSNGYVIRARVKRDLVLLSKAMWPGPVVGLITTKDADYRYRLEISQDELRDLMIFLAAEVDYSNFKGMIEKSPTQKDKLHGYHEMWQQARYWQCDEGSPKLKNKKRNQTHKHLRNYTDEERAEIELEMRQTYP